MVFLLLAAVLALAWFAGAIQLSPRAHRLHSLSMWLAIGWSLATVACIGYGASGLLREGGWTPLSNGHALHALLGEGNLAMRRSEWNGLNRAAGAWLALDLAWTLLVLCAVQFHAHVFWAGVAERQRQARVRRAG